MRRGPVLGLIVAVLAGAVVATGARAAGPVPVGCGHVRLPVGGLCAGQQLAPLRAAGHAVHRGAVPRRGRLPVPVRGGHRQAKALGARVFRFGVEWGVEPRGDVVDAARCTA